jgi:phospholipid transport system substrate-binding protein
MPSPDPRRSRTLAALVAAAVLMSGGPALAADAAAAPDTAELDAAAASVVDGDPGKLIDTAAQAMLQLLDSHREAYRKDPHLVDRLVDRILLPHFDTDYSARLVLGRHWNDATPEQRRRFQDAFYHSLLGNYGSALLEFTADRLKVLPFRGDASAPNATVRTQVRKHDGTEVSVNYTLRHAGSGWKAWDVVIEGISYVKSFRDDFGAEIDHKGLDAVNARLEAQASRK